uniref:Rhodopsin n=1 Tax=Proboscia inermis TaxID=420281 RepID=A0A7S0CIM7_9STRA|mmetsp:Transcript_49456/g.49827  ORF Transcript_49456/g.49827 Transcript_49456/m.49827 type:complete len:256 (+) Transcript_49456:124-891(+)
MGNPPVTTEQFDLVYDVLSFSLATMMATTIFIWMRLGEAAARYKSAVIISGLVTFIAAYHYFRIFNSWVEAYSYDGASLTPTDIPFNDAYRYMDWLLTVPLLLIEIILVMKLSAEESSSKSVTLGAAAALMIIAGYPGEIVLDADQANTRWMYWGAAMLPFSYIVYTLLVGLSGATNAEEDAEIRGKIKQAQVLTVISWCTYPVVYVFPMMGITGSNAVVAIQIGYSVSDIISKCAVGLLITDITISKSNKLRGI